MLEIIIVAVVAALFGGAVLAAITWPWARDSIEVWLRNHNLEESVLMTAIVRMDDVWIGGKRVLNQARCRLFVTTTTSTRERYVSESVVDIGEIPNEEVRAQLRAGNKPVLLLYQQG